MTRALEELLNDLNTPRAEHPERDYFARPKVAEDRDRDTRPEWSGAGWSGEWVRGNWGGGRDR
jgi:hypothetical protein